MSDFEERLRLLESEIERRLLERFAALRDEFDRLRLEADSRWAGFLTRFDQDFTGIVPSELVPPPPAPTPAPAPVRTAALPGQVSIEAARALDDAENQVEALNRFLDACRRYASRAALLIAKGGGLGVWKAVGFSEHGGSDEGARKRGLSVEEGGLLARVMEGAPCRLEKGNDVSAQLGCGDAARAVLIPMVVKEKISGAVYADCAPGKEEQFDPESIGLLTFVAGLMVDRLASRKLKPAPPLRSLDAVSAAAAASPPADRYGTQMMEISPEVDVAPPPPSPPVETAPEPRGWAMPAPAPRPHFVEPSPTKPSGVTPMPAEESFGGSVEAEAPVEPPSAVSPVRPSTGARRLAGPLARAEGDERREEARRFAKLLVSEIKLYNERAVLEGREQGNIYERLKEDIDRSRQMYDERIPEDVRASSNFFHEELVRILANGRAEALGA
ncbi:MAG TPA: hypothetical protein VLO07_05525 [Thermoanaerobaculia bacterium]|nr:hypothetical protein [Thermoanaerobaculia bacterium]